MKVVIGEDFIKAVVVLQKRGRRTISELFGGKTKRQTFYNWQRELADKLASDATATLEGEIEIVANLCRKIGYLGPSLRLPDETHAALTEYFRARGEPVPQSESPPAVLLDPDVIRLVTDDLKMIADLTDATPVGEDAIRTRRLNDVLPMVTAGVGLLIMGLAVAFGEPDDPPLRPSSGSERVRPPIVELKVVGDQPERVLEGEALNLLVKLSAAPETEVIVTVATQGVSSRKSRLTFDQFNWWEPQSLPLTVPDDSIAEGERTATVSLVAVGDDARVNGRSIELKLSIEDDDLLPLLRDNLWIGYDPSTSRPGHDPTDEELIADLKVLKRYGASIITFGADPGSALARVPRIAHNLDVRVLMGVYINPGWREANLRQLQTAAGQSKYVDAYIVSHAEVGEHSLDQLDEDIEWLRSETGKAVSTSFPYTAYLGKQRGQAIRELGDFLCPDCRLDFRNGTTPQKLLSQLRETVERLTEATDRPILVKMVAYPAGPTSVHPGLTLANQAAFFAGIARHDVPLPRQLFLSYFTAFDPLPAFKPDPAVEHHLGLFTNDRRPKPAAQRLKRLRPDARR